MATKEKLSTKKLTKEEFEQLRLCQQDPIYLAQFVDIVHPVKGSTKFKLYPYQKKLLWYFMFNQFTQILKFRQAGVTECIALFCLWLAMYHSYKNIIIISIKDTVAKKFLSKIKRMYRSLENHLKIPIVNGKGKDVGTARDIEFSNGSMISSIPTTENAGRSEAVSLLVIDEAAIVRWADQIWAAAFPTLSTGGSAIINSTAYGIGNWFHKLWVNAISGGNEFIPIRLKWQMHPERDDKWYDLQRKTLGHRRTAQEIDGDFLTSGDTVFDLLDIRSIEEELSDYVVKDVKYGGALRIYNHPEKNNNYWIGADIATGRSRDYSAFSIMDKEGIEVACFKKKIPVDKFADLLMEMGKKYNKALLAPETNDIGLAVTSKIQEAGYTNLYYSYKLLKEKGQKKAEQIKVPGWLTTMKNRSVIIAELEEDIRLGNITIKDPFFIQEAYTFIYDEQNRPIAMGKHRRTGFSNNELEGEGYTDDSIMAKAITNHIRKTKRYGITVLPI